MCRLSPTLTNFSRTQVGQVYQANLPGMGRTWTWWRWRRWWWKEAFRSWGTMDLFASTAPVLLTTRIPFTQWNGGMWQKEEYLGYLEGAPIFSLGAQSPMFFLSVKSVQECRYWFLEALVSNVMEPCTFNFSPDPWSPNPTGRWRDGWHFRLPKYSAHSVLRHVEEKQNQNCGWKSYPCGKFCYNQEITLRWVHRNRRNI